MDQLVVIAKRTAFLFKPFDPTRGCGKTQVTCQSGWMLISLSCVNDGLIHVSSSESSVTVMIPTFVPFRCFQTNWCQPDHLSIAAITSFANCGCEETAVAFSGHLMGPFTPRARRKR